MSQPKIESLVMNSPIGLLNLSADQVGIVEISFSSKSHRKPILSKTKHPHLIRGKKELEEYFKGRRVKFSLPLSFSKGTDFQKKVWKALSQIPFGQLASYEEIAKKIGKPKAVRAVGTANSKNPIAIVIPCHRVVRKSGAIGGYAGGLSIKRELLRLEKAELKAAR